MNFFGLGFWEVFFILLIVLIVVGPERLPQLARQLGLLIAQVQSWIQRSPDAAMILQARRELEREIETLRRSMLEMQQAQQQLVTSARQALDQPLAELQSVSDHVKGIGATVGSIKAGVPAIPSAVGLDESPLDESPLDEPLFAADAAPLLNKAEGNTPPLPTISSPMLSSPTEDAAPLFQPATGTVSACAPSSPMPVPLPAKEALPPVPAVQDRYDELLGRLQALAADLEELRQALHQRGLLDDQWRAAQHERLEDTPDPVVSTSRE